MRSRDLTVSTIKCELCDKIFTNCNPKISMYKHRIWCEGKYEFLRKYNIDPMNLEELYDKNGSVLGFMEKYPYWNNHNQYYKLFKEFGVNVSLSHAANNDIVIKKREKTHINKYGAKHNFCKNSKSRKKWEKRLLKEEGITNVFQREDVKKKSLKTILKKYGTELWIHAITIRGAGVISKINKKIFEVLENNNIKFYIEHKINRDDKSYYSYDILLDNKKIIEINGDYWHGNPQKYKSSDILLKGSSKEMLVKEKWEYDKNKIEFAQNNGYEVLVVWESEIKEDIEKVVKKIIRYAKSKNKINKKN